MEIARPPATTIAAAGNGKAKDQGRHGKDANGMNIFRRTTKCRKSNDSAKRRRSRTGTVGCLVVGGVQWSRVQGEVGGNDGAKWMGNGRGRTGPGARMWAAIAKRVSCWAVKWVRAQEPRPAMAAKTKPSLSRQVPGAERRDRDTHSTQGKLLRIGAEQCKWELKRTRILMSPAADGGVFYPAALAHAGKTDKHKTSLLLRAQSYAPPLAA